VGRRKATDFETRLISALEEITDRLESLEASAAAIARALEEIARRMS